MPLFALHDANMRVVNTIAAASKQDITHAVTHGVGVEGDLAYEGGHEELLDACHRKVEGYGKPVMVPTDAILRAHGATGAIEITAKTGPAAIGMVFEDGVFMPGPAPLADASNDDLAAEVRRRGLAQA